MGDPDFISGMIGFAIQMAFNQITDWINIVVRCGNELDCLKHLVHQIHSINTEMQKYRKALNFSRIDVPPNPLLLYAICWLIKLDDLLREGPDSVHLCNAPSLYRLSFQIFEKHVASTPSIAFPKMWHLSRSDRQSIL
ncbi:hypothetical protein SUGI_0202120 [Cryptomeria japonica]|nr:hypothetical protein SUGI_0202120 [Cryptomeria japonica]